MPARERIVQALTADDGTLRREGLTLVVDHILDQKVATWLDTDALSALLMAAWSQGNPGRAIARHIQPGLTRVREQLRSAELQLGEAVPASARLAIEGLVGHTQGPRFAWLAGALDRDKLRALLAPAFQDVFVSFAARLPIAGGDAAASAASAAAGLMGRLGRGTTERLRTLGKSVADNLGVDLEGRLREVARDSSQAAVGSFQRAIEARLRTAEGEQLASELSLGVLAHVLATPITTILDDLDRLPLAKAIDVAAPIIEHNVADELWRSIITREVQATLALEGERTLRELLEEAGLTAHVRTQLLERGDGVLRELFGSPTFGAWLDRLLVEP